MRKQATMFLVLMELLFLASCGGNTPAPAALSVTKYPLPLPTSGAQWITTGPDGNLWFTGLSLRVIGRSTPVGQITEFPLPESPSQSELGAITTGPDGNLWFTAGDQIGQMTLTGQVTLFPMPTNASARGITAGPDGALWFTELDTNNIGRFTPPR